MSNDDGFTLVELMVASAIGLVMLLITGSLIVSAGRAESHTIGTSQTIDAARLVLTRLADDVRGADFLSPCSTSGDCMQIGTRTASGVYTTHRWRQYNEDLVREVYDPATTTWSSPETVLDRVMNTTGQPVFRCDETATLVRLVVDLRIKPTPSSSPVLKIATTVRPRNFPATEVCP